jgi:SepF-like predicted cell division protein (DUF552 family)
MLYIVIAKIFFMNIPSEKVCENCTVITLEFGFHILHSIQVMFIITWENVNVSKKMEY